MVKFQPAGNANRFGVMRFDVKFQDVRVLEYVFAPWTAHLNIVMNPHVDVEKIRVFELLVARATLEHMARGILVLFDFVDLERTRGGEALATVRAHPHSATFSEIMQLCITVVLLFLLFCKDISIISHS